MDLVAFCHIAQILNVESEVACPLRDYMNEECKNLVGLYNRMKVAILSSYCHAKKTTCHCLAFWEQNVFKINSMLPYFSHFLEEQIARRKEHEQHEKDRDVAITQQLVSQFPIS